MRSSTKRFLPLTAMLIAGILLGTGPAFAGDEELTIGAGNVMGVYYAAGSGVAKLFNRQRDEYHQWLVTVASQGSIENIDGVLAGTNQFGLAQANILDRAVRGKSPWAARPQTSLRAVLGLYTEALTIVVAGDSEIHRVADLQGKRVNIGAPGSSDQFYTRPILAEAGLRLEDMTFREEPSVKASDLLEAGKIDAYIFTVGHPSLSVREASSGKSRARLLPLDLPLIQRCLAARPLLQAVTIPTGHYPGLEHGEPLATVGVQVVLFTDAGMDDETVYRIVKAVMTNLDLFRQQQPALAGLTASAMATVPAIPLHPGAKRYFREAGLLPKQADRPGTK